MKNNWPDHRQTILAISIAAALTAVTVDAAALTLGRASVQSALGQTMRAEIEFESLNAAEAESLRASLATPDEYRAAGAQFNPALAGARVVLQRIANRRASLLITSDRIIQEPFVEVVLDLNWRGGRLVRNYTLLFDPPGTRPPPRPASLTPYANPSGLAGPGATAPATVAPPPVAAAPVAPLPRTESRRSAPAPAPAAVSRRGPPPPGSPPAPPLVDDPYRVRTGDTLSEVAQRGVRPAGISLDRLVLAMYRDNPDAFVDGNIHKLKKGVVLSAAKDATIASVTDAEARRVIKAQAADFDAYRRQLAESPTERPSSSTRSASGKLDADVQVRDQASSRSPDVLTLSKPGPAASAPATDAAMAEALKREREKAEAKVAELSKNVQDLERLQASAASQPAAPGTPPPATSTETPAGAGPAVAVGAASPASTPEPTASAAPPAPPALASAPAVRPPPAAAPAPAAEPGLMDTLLDDNVPAVSLGAALLALLAGFGIFRLLKRRREAAPETSFLESRLQPDSFFGTSGGERVDTSEVPASGSNSSMMNYSLSQLDAIGDVDPVAEADVYMAYGRDMQAEEILKEAIRTNPDRLPVRTKLLEVYAKRRDTKGFEVLAQELFAITKGQGEDWAKARQLGLQIDPENPLYHDGAPPAMPSADPGPSLPPVGLGAATMPLSVLPGDPPANSGFDLDLDLDLGIDDVPPPAAPAPTPGARAKAPADEPFQHDADNLLNFSTSGFTPQLPDIGSPPPAPATPAPVPPPPPPAAKPGDPFSASEFALDLDLPEPSALSPGPSMLPPIEDVDLPLDDLGQPSDFDPDSGLDEGDPLARKLELADEFRQIGDIDGARDLLQEVIASADGALKNKAQAMLDNLS